MKKKPFFVAFSAFGLTTLLLYAAGHLFTIEWLMLHRNYYTETGRFAQTGSIVPVLSGVAVSYLAEKLYVYKTAK